MLIYLAKILMVGSGYFYMKCWQLRRGVLPILLSIPGCYGQFQENLYMRLAYRFVRISRFLRYYK